QGRELNLGTVAIEDGSSDCAAEVDVEALPFAIVALEAEARQAGINAAAHRARALDVVQCRGTGRQSGDSDDCGTEKRFDIGFHVFPFSCFVVRGLPQTQGSRAVSRPGASSPKLYPHRISLMVRGQ